MDFHRTSSYLVTASDDESIRLYDVASATYESFYSPQSRLLLITFTSLQLSWCSALLPTILLFWGCCDFRCLKTINSKKYGVDLVCFTSHPTTVIYSSKNGWDGNVNLGTYLLFACKFIPLFFLIYQFKSLESLRLLSLNDNKYLRYFRGHHDRFIHFFLSSLLPGSMFGIYFQGIVYELEDQL